MPKTRIIKIDELKKGDIIAERIENSFGSIIVSEKTVITKKLVLLLKKFDVERVAIEAGIPKNESEKSRKNAEKKIVTEEEQEVINRFTGHEKNPVMMKIRNAIIDNLKQADQKD